MRLAAIMTMTAMMTATMGANAEAKPVSGRLVTVYLQDKAEVPVFIKAQAQRQATHMFAEIGVKLVWKEGNPSSHDAGAIAIELGNNTPVALAPGALAFALPYEGIHVRVFCDQIDPDPAMRGSTTEAVLAHVMVHEITHILQGIARHSAEGIMKAQWTNSDRAAHEGEASSLHRRGCAADCYRHGRSRGQKHPVGRHIDNCICDPDRGGRTDYAVNGP